MKDWQTAAKLFKRTMKKSKKSKKSKAKAQKYHAMGRYYKRFHRPLTEEEYQRLVKEIKTQKAEFLERQSNRITVWKVSIHGNKAVAFYDKERKTIVTFITTYMYQHPNEDRELLLN